MNIHYYYLGMKYREKIIGGYVFFVLFLVRIVLYQRISKEYDESIN